MKTNSLTLRKHPWLWIRFYWYRLIRGINILGFYDGVPIIGFDLVCIVHGSAKEE